MKSGPITEPRWNSHIPSEFDVSKGYSKNKTRKNRWWRIAWKQGKNRVGKGRPPYYSWAKTRRVTPIWYKFTTLYRTPKRICLDSSRQKIMHFLLRKEGWLLDKVSTLWKLSQPLRYHVKFEIKVFKILIHFFKSNRSLYHD